MVMIKKSVFYCLLALIAGESYSSAFLSTTPQSSLYGPTSTRLESSGSSGERPKRHERIEAKIYPNGRVEYVVKGIKGPECLELVEAINKDLGGRVISTEPTEEFFQQEVTVDQTLTNSNVENGDSWQGASSW
jgi:hypothetical protein